MGNLKTKAGKENFNLDRSLTLVWDASQGGYDFWIMSKGGVEIAQENRIATLLPVVDYPLKKQAHKHALVMPNLDINGIMSGIVDVSDMPEAFRRFDAQCTASGSGGFICLQGANRSGHCTCAFLMAKTGCKAAAALAFLKSIRPIVDISKPARESLRPYYLPMTFLCDHEEDLWSMFPKIGVPHFPLPAVVTPREFMACCTQNWAAVPEYATRYIFGGERASGRAPMSTTEWLATGRGQFPPPPDTPAPASSPLPASSSSGPQQSITGSARIGSAAPQFDASNTGSADANTGSADANAPVSAGTIIVSKDGQASIGGEEQVSDEVATFLASPGGDQRSEADYGGRVPQKTEHTSDVDSVSDRSRPAATSGAEDGVGSVTSGSVKSPAAKKRALDVEATQAQRIIELSERCALFESQVEDAQMNERNWQEECATLKLDLQKIHVQRDPVPSGSGGPLAEQEKKEKWEADAAYYQAQTAEAAIIIDAIHARNIVVATNTLGQPGLNWRIALNFRDGNGMTLLHAACRMQCAGFIDQFLDRCS